MTDAALLSDRFDWSTFSRVLIPGYSGKPVAWVALFARFRLDYWAHIVASGCGVIQTVSSYLCVSFHAACLTHHSGLCAYYARRFHIHFIGYSCVLIAYSTRSKYPNSESLNSKWFRRYQFCVPVHHLLRACEIFDSFTCIGVIWFLVCWLVICWTLTQIRIRHIWLPRFCGDVRCLYWPVHLVLFSWKPSDHYLVIHT